MNQSVYDDAPPELVLASDYTRDLVGAQSVCLVVPGRRRALVQCSMLSARSVRWQPCVCVRSTHFSSTRGKSGDTNLRALHLHKRHAPRTGSHQLECL